jgi:hypothetical protein
MSLPTRYIPWSPSGLKGFETCARQFYALRVSKTATDTPGAAAQFGVYGHKAFEEAVRDNTPLPLDLKVYAPLVERIKALPGEKFAELQMGVREDWSPCAFDDPEAWHRGIIDLLVINGAQAGIIDYKFGKPHRDMTQLLANATCVFAAHPKVKVIDTRYWWIAHGGHTTPLRVHRGDLPVIHAKLRNRVARIDTAFQRNSFPPSPSGLCKKHCTVFDCEFNGRKKA